MWPPRGQTQPDTARKAGLDASSRENQPAQLHRRGRGVVEPKAEDEAREEADNRDSNQIELAECHRVDGGVHIVHLPVGRQAALLQSNE